MSRLSARRRESNTKVGHERWLVSYSDFITLLFAFFVVMYSVSQVNESKYRSLTETLSAAFANQPQPEALEGSQENTLAELNSLSESITNALDGFPVQGQVAMGANENWVELTLSSELLFSSGSAEPSEEALTVFSELATLLEPFDNEIQIVGHTDNVPIRNSEFANNWSLSSARAVAIVDYLSFQGINPDQMSAVAFGEYRPVADNTTAEGRALNRRVVLRISDQSVAAPQRSPDQLELNQSADSLQDQDSGAEAAEPNLTNQSLTNPNLTNQSLTNQSEPKSEQNDEARLGSSDSAVQPVRFKGGDLLFTSDPDLPRLRELEEESETE